MPINPLGIQVSACPAAAAETTDFASAVTLCLSHEDGELESSQIVASKAMKAVVPEIDTSAEVQCRAYSGARLGHSENRSPRGGTGVHAHRCDDGQRDQS